MEIWDIDRNDTFKQSDNFNSDGLPRAERLNLWEGFRCTQGAQTETELEGGISKCPNVKVRYQCIDGAIDLQGRIFTTFFDRVDQGEDEDANRLFFQPKFRSEDGVIMGDCDLFLYRNDDSELALVRQKISGDNGMLRCLANVAEPGTYNVTFRVQDHGDSVASSKFRNYLTNEKMDGYNFEVFDV